MKRSARLTLSRPWRNGLILTTGLSLLVFGAGELWHSGLPEWAFVLSFITTWCLISLFWSNDRYIEGSNKVLAGIVDYNFEKLNIPADHPARDTQDTFYCSSPGSAATLLL